MKQTGMAHPTDSLKKGDIAINHFPVLDMPKYGPPTKAQQLGAHPVVVLGVDHEKKEAMVVLLGSEKEGNGSSQMGLSAQDQKMAKLDRPSIYKPQQVAMVPLNKLDPTEGHLPAATMNRIEQSVARAAHGGARMAHLHRDGSITEHGNEKILMESPWAKPTKASSSVVAEVAPTKAHVAESVAKDARLLHKGSEAAEIGHELLRIGQRNLTKLSGGLAGDVQAAFDISKSVTTLVDNHTGNLLTKGAVGQAVAYAGEHSGAFEAIYKLEQASEPYIAKAHTVMDPYLEKASQALAYVGEKTGVTAVIDRVEELSSKGVDWSSTQISHIQKAYNEVMVSGGFQVDGLSIGESAQLLSELKRIQPGDSLTIDRNGSVELHPAGQSPGVGKDKILLDAQAFKDKAHSPEQTRSSSQERSM